MLRWRSLRFDTIDLIAAVARGMVAVVAVADVRGEVWACVCGFDVDGPACVDTVDARAEPVSAAGLGGTVRAVGRAPETPAWVVVGSCGDRTA